MTRATKPCKDCNIRPRYALLSYCRQCNNARRRARYQEVVGPVHSRREYLKAYDDFTSIIGYPPTEFVNGSDPVGDLALILSILTNPDKVKLLRDRGPKK